MKFYTIEIPIAMSMIALAEQADHVFQRYFSFWAAFNNIYALVGTRQGIVTRLDKDNNGQVRFRPDGSFSFPRVITPREIDQIREAACQLDVGVKDALIKNPNVAFFVNRVPKGAPGPHDSQGQPINGVLNITRTVNPNLPVWSPIEKQAYEHYLAGDASSRDLLAEQIIFLLYTIRNNLVHGSKSPDEANDVEVVEKALPLLELVVEAFIQ
jgi:hypothetical protein